MIAGTSARDTIAEVVGQFVREELSNENVHIASVVESMLGAGGKHLRPRITLLASQAREPKAPPDPVLAAYMELIHVATLIHDDVVDAADTRRGRDSTNRAQGNRFSVLAGDYLFAWVFKKITLGYAAPIPSILSGMLAEICNGEVKQLRAAGDMHLTKERYFEIIGKKTAELFASCAEVGALRALHHAGAHPTGALRDDPATKALRSFGWSFGMAFQIRDDVLDITADEATLGKPAGSDLRERRVTLPLIFALSDGEADGSGALHDRVQRLFAAVEAGETDTGESAAIVETLRANRAVTRATAAAAEYASEAEAALATLPHNEAVDELRHLARTLMTFSS